MAIILPTNASLSLPNCREMGPRLASGQSAEKTRSHGGSHRSPSRWLPTLGLAVLATSLLSANVWAQSATTTPIPSDQPVSPLGQALAEDQAKREAGEAPPKTVVEEFLETYIANEDIARASFLTPPGATSISKKNKLYIDRKRQRVYIDGYIAMREAALEMFACPVGTKEHESIVATLAPAKEVHAGLLAIGAKPGSPVKFMPDFVPPSGQTIRIWVCWRDEAGKFQVVDARKWIIKTGTKDEPMTADWVFGGSGFWKDPSDGREYYRADGGDMICVSNFTTAMIDVNTPSSAEAGQLVYFPKTDVIPPRGTPVRLILVPIETAKPDTEREKSKTDATKTAKKPANEKMPTEMVLPVNPIGKQLKARKVAAEKAAQR